jgi:hypothetical protein
MTKIERPHWPLTPAKLAWDATATWLAKAIFCTKAELKKMQHQI